jgi:uncharacterized protein YbgA (DUF1722 family)
MQIKYNIPKTIMDSVVNDIIEKIKVLDGITNVDLHRTGFFNRELNIYTREYLNPDEVFLLGAYVGQLETNQNNK